LKKQILRERFSSARGGSKGKRWNGISRTKGRGTGRPQRQNNIDKDVSEQGRLRYAGKIKEGGRDDKKSGGWK